MLGKEPFETFCNFSKNGISPSNFNVVQSVDDMIKMLIFKINFEPLTDFSGSIGSKE